MPGPRNLVRVVGLGLGSRVGVYGWGLGLGLVSGLGLGLSIERPRTVYPQPSADAGVVQLRAAGAVWRHVRRIACLE